MIENIEGKGRRNGEIIKFLCAFYQLLYNFNASQSSDGIGMMNVSKGKIYTFSFRSWEREWVIKLLWVCKASLETISMTEFINSVSNSSMEKLSLKTIYPSLARILHSNFTAFSFLVSRRSFSQVIKFSRTSHLII